MDYKILLVEDEKKTGEFLKKALEDEGMNVDWAVDGKSAIELIEKGKYDLIILDLKLPELSGADVLEQIRLIDPYVETIVYTNYPTDSFDPSIIKKLFKYGVEEYVNKGADADLWEMVEKVKAILDPLSENEIDSLLEAAPENSFKEETDE
ncbi:MAG: response regulator [Candidatus Thorarchaeota archaeon]